MWQAFLTLVEDRTERFDNKDFVNAILMDLSKRFDTLNHEILKRHAYGFQHDFSIVLSLSGDTEPQ